MAKTSVQEMPQRYLSQSSPPPNAKYVAIGRKFVGRGSPEGEVLGYIGDEYLDLDDGQEWNKIEGSIEHRETPTGWEKALPIYTQEEVDALFAVANARFVSASDLTDLADRDFNSNYHAALVESDENGEAGLFFWDPTVTTADAVSNSIIPLVDGVGGFKRKGF